jgi:MFS family permease
MPNAPLEPDPRRRRRTTERKPFTSLIHKPLCAAYAVVLGVAGLGGALVLVNILPLVFDLGADTQFGTYTGLAAVPVQAAAVVGPSVAGLLVEATGSQRTLFGIAAVAMGSAWVLLQRVQVETVPRSVHPGQGPGHRPLG